MHDPEAFESYKKAANGATSEFVVQLISDMNWNVGERILDFGCGSGSVAKNYLLPKAKLFNSRIDGLDISDDMINYASIHHADPLIEYHLGNICDPDYPLKGILYDKIVSIHVLHHIKDNTKIINQFAKYLKRGGQLAFSMCEPKFVHGALKALGNSEKWAPYMKGYENFIPTWYDDNQDIAEYLDETLSNAGFRVVHLRRILVHRTPPLDACLDLFVSLNPFVKDVPKELLPELRNDYLKFAELAMMIDMDPNGKQFICHWKAPTFVCLAIKE